MTLQQYYEAMVELTSQRRGAPELQAFFAAMHRLCLMGMGVGSGGSVAESGEIRSLQHVRDVLAQDGSQGRVIFDVGAHQGQFATTAAEIFPDFEIYAFEPSQATYDQLVANVERLGERCRAFRLGLSDQAGEVQLHTNAEGSALASLYKRRLEHFGFGMDQAETVPLQTLDGFCAARGIASIGLLKIDVEGHELAVMHGARTMIDQGRIRFIQFEFGGCNIDSRTFFQDFWYFLDAYQISRIIPGGLHRIEAYRETQEMFLTQNFLAELKP